MASLKNRRETWYARIRMVINGRKAEKRKPPKMYFTIHTEETDT